MTKSNDRLNSKHYPGLDTLRGIAILMVLVYHNFSIIPFAFLGSLGVDLFFVLSGFLITGILLRASENGGQLRNFYIKRVLRIFPVYFVTLLVIIFLLPALFTVGYDVQYYRQHQYWFYFFVQNFLFVLQPLEKKNLLNHFWSLAIEEQFYLLWPVFIFFYKKTARLIYILPGLLIIVFSVRLTLYCLHGVSNLIFTFFRIDGLLVGCFLAFAVWKEITLSKRLQLVILAAVACLNLLFLILTTVLQKDFAYFPCCGYTSFAVLFGLLVYRMVCSTSTNNSSPATSILQFLGKISYGLYAYHWPVFVLLSPAIQAALTHGLKLRFSASSLIAAFITTLAAVLLSAVSYRYFEKFFLQLKSKYN